MAKVSVIIPTYNRGGYIGHAIESVFAQTTSDIEVIVIDDGSTDDTPERMHTFSGRVRYVRTGNKGPAHARNIGMGMSTGDYISFLDSDDLYYPFKTDLQASVLDAFPDLGMVSSDFSGFDEKGFWDDFHLKHYHDSAFRGGLSFDRIYPEKVSLKELGLAPQGWEDGWLYLGNIFNTYFQHMVVCTNTMMFRRRILDRVGFQNERFRLLEDHHFALRITKYCKVAFIDIPTYKLRYHAAQISDVTRGSSRKDGLEIVIEKQRNLLETSMELGMGDPEYYISQREMVDRRLAVLHKAIAIPLMCRPDGAAESRFLLRSCAKFGRSEKLMGMATFLPLVGRKAVVKLYNMLKNR